jgi:hypothetical protein
MDQTNRYSWGKVIVHVNKISNFQFTSNILIKISLGPWQVHSKRIINEKLDWNQTFYIPTPHNFVTIKLEVISLQSDGWFKEHFKENVIAAYEIRLPDINKRPFDADGNIVLPLPEIKEPKKLGLLPIERPSEDGDGDLKSKQK